MTMTKSDLIARVHESGAVSTMAEAQELVEAILDGMKEALAQGEDLKVSGFGVFEVRDKAAHAGRNPKTGGEIEIAARRVVRFKGSPALRNKVNGGS